MLNTEYVVRKCDFCFVIESAEQISNFTQHRDGLDMTQFLREFKKILGTFNSAEVTYFSH